MQVVGNKHHVTCITTNLSTQTPVRARVRQGESCHEDGSPEWSAAARSPRRSGLFPSARRPLAAAFLRVFPSPAAARHLEDSWARHAPLHIATQSVSSKCSCQCSRGESGELTDDQLADSPPQAVLADPQQYLQLGPLAVHLQEVDHCPLLPLLDARQHFWQGTD